MLLLKKKIMKATDIKPSGTGESPLANITEWVNVTDENGRKGRRETNTMPQWAGSSWKAINDVGANSNAMFAQFINAFFVAIKIMSTVDHHGGFFMNGLQAKLHPEVSTFVQFR